MQIENIEAYHITLRAINADDLEMLRNWRNMPEIRLNMINQEIISTEQQQKWFLSLAKLNQEHYIVEYKGQPIGYANFKPFSKKGSGQTGLYIGDAKYRGTVLAFCLAMALLDHVFLQLKVNSLNAGVLLHNSPAIRFNEQLGYIYQGESEGLVKMKLRVEDYLAAKKNLCKIIRV